MFKKVLDPHSRNLIVKKNIFSLFLVFLICIFSPLCSSPSYGDELDLSSAQNRIGKRFAAKFCEAKKQGHSGDASSEFALNNTFLKFADLPDDDNYMNDLWGFTKIQIIETCGEQLTKKDVIELKEFFSEETEIARNRDLYLPNIEYVFSPKEKSSTLD